MFIIMNMADGGCARIGLLLCPSNSGSPHAVLACGHALLIFGPGAFHMLQRRVPKSRSSKSMLYHSTYGCETQLCASISTHIHSAPPNPLHHAISDDS